ncbi:putative ABC transport system permease protein [Pedobacter sp. UYP30]|uniref:ABC transporter permease n=1 Tax=Pedobacter sp. UYP30 TaxID=1756400 RepID=UPI003398595B
MNKLDFKIAIRSFLKGKWYNLLNILGLALGLAAFIFVALYVNHEKNYDQSNKNINRIFLVEREMPNGTSPYTPALLAAAIKSQCAEVEEVGRMNTALFQIPFYTPSGKFLIKKWTGADYSIAKILNIQPKGFKLNPNSSTPTVLLSKKTAKALFPKDSIIVNKTANMMARSGMPITVAGVVRDKSGNTNLKFDCIGFSADLASGKDQSYATQIYQTFLLVKPNADIPLLSKKIDMIYREAAEADTSNVAKQLLKQTTTSTIFLDPLNNLHLKPHYGSSVNNQIVQSLSLLAIIILVITGINFTNLYISQANKRAKEVGVKKVNGVGKKQIISQFMLEIFAQCFVALILAGILVVAALPFLNQLLQVNLLISGINTQIIFQVLLTLILLTALAGIYPSLVMAGFKPAEVLRGDQFSIGGKLSLLKKSITVLQFTCAIVFAITLMVINQQVTYMKTENPGFSAKQVIYIDNLALYNNPKTFVSLRNRIEAMPGVKVVTVASNVPGGIFPASHEYNFRERAFSMNTITVDYGYFKTLDIGLKEGHVFNSTLPGDSTNAIINEAAAKAINLTQPIGNTINGCGGAYKIIGVIKDVKANGFEENVKPTIYLMNDHCGLAKTQIMISAENNAIPTILKTLNREWRDINKLDGENFNYHFLDELYGQLFVKQEQLKAVVGFFTGLAIFISALGFFSLAAQSIKLRMKEIAIRKVFGADKGQLMIILSKPFFYIVLIANIIAWPVALVLVNKWLQTFAYRVDLSVVPFVMALLLSFIIVALTVCLQIFRAIGFKPAEKLKE